MLQQITILARWNTKSCSCNTAVPLNKTQVLHSLGTFERTSFQRETINITSGKHQVSQMNRSLTVSISLSWFAIQIQESGWWEHDFWNIFDICTGTAFICFVRRHNQCFIQATFRVFNGWSWWFQDHNVWMKLQGPHILTVEGDGRYYFHVEKQEIIGYINTYTNDIVLISSIYTAIQ